MADHRKVEERERKRLKLRGATISLSKEEADKQRKQLKYFKEQHDAQLRSEVDSTLDMMKFHMRIGHDLSGTIPPLAYEPKTAFEGTVRGNRFNWEACVEYDRSGEKTGCVGYRPYAGLNSTTRFISRNVVLDEIHTSILPILTKHVLDTKGVSITTLCRKIAKEHADIVRWLGKTDGIENVPPSENTNNQTLKAVVFWLYEHSCYKLYLVFGRMGSVHVLLDYFYVSVREKNENSIFPQDCGANSSATDV